MHNEQIKTGMEQVSSKYKHYFQYLKYHNDSDAYKWSLKWQLRYMPQQSQS
jgi:hypothetical protein